MRQAKIVTDGTAELDPHIAEDLNIQVLPLQVRVQHETLAHAADGHSVAFHQANLKASATPSVVGPSQSAYTRTYTRLAKETDRIISIHSSAPGVDTVAPARRAAAELLGRVQIEIVDCLFTSRAMGLIVQKGAEALVDGASPDRVVRLVRGLIPRTYFAFYVEKLSYLRSSSAGTGLRAIGPSSANTQPILVLENGVIAPQFRKRNKGSALERLLDFVAEFQQTEELVIVHSGLMTDVHPLRDHLIETYGTVEEHIYGPALTSVIGPKAVGVVVTDK